MRVLDLPYSKDYLKNRLARLREEMQTADLEDLDEYFKILLDCIDSLDHEDSLYLINTWHNLTQAYMWFSAYTGFDNEE